MAVADLPHPLEVARRRRETAPGVLHRFEEDRGHGFRPLHLDGQFDLVSCPSAECLNVVAVFGCPVEVGVRHLQRPRHQRLERGLSRGDPGDAQCPVGGAVVGHRTTDDLCLERLASDTEELLGQLPGALHGFTTPCGEEDAVEVTRRQMGQAFCQFDRLRMGVGPQWEERQLASLCCRYRREIGTAVPHLDHEKPGQPVEVTAAVVVEDAHALASHDDRHVRPVLVHRVAGEVHPQMAIGPSGEWVVAGLRDELRRGAHRVPQV